MTSLESLTSLESMTSSVVGQDVILVKEEEVVSLGEGVRLSAEARRARLVHMTESLWGWWGRKDREEGPPAARERRGRERTLDLSCVC